MADSGISISNMLSHAALRAYERHGLTLTHDDLVALGAQYRSAELTVIGRAGIIDASGKWLNDLHRFYCWSQTYQCHLVFDEQYRCIVTFLPSDFDPAAEYAHRTEQEHMFMQTRVGGLIRNKTGPIPKQTSREAEICAAAVG